MLLITAAKILNTPLISDNCEFSNISTDTRTLQAGDLFIALTGPNFDGHDFIATAAEKGACAMMVERQTSTPLPQLIVKNTTEALGLLAAYHRQQFHIPVIGITGSCGKTSTRALTASILNQCGPTLFSESSFNNAIGVPLTLFRLRSDHQYAVIEMGTNHFGEIAYLTQLAKPTIAVITNAAAAHLEFLLDLDGVARAKGEIFLGLDAQGTAVLNADDAQLHVWEKMVQPSCKILRFSLTKPTDFYAKQIEFDSEGKPHFTLVTPLGETNISLPLLGKHNVANALAAAAATYAMGASLAAIKAGLEQSNAVKKRLNAHTLAPEVVLIDDSYNANPLSVTAAIEALAQRGGNTILVLGDMKELGPRAQQHHTDIGQLAKKSGITHLYTYGTLSNAATTAFGDGAQHFTDQTALIDSLKRDVTPPATLLVKGSLSMRMSKVVESLLSGKINSKA